MPMQQLFSIDQQQQHFEKGKSLFLEGHYAESEAVLRLVVESSLQHQDYTTCVQSIIWLNRVFINTTQFDEMYGFLLMINPLINTYGTEEDILFCRFQTCIFNSHYSIGDVMGDFEKLFDEALQTPFTQTTFLIGSNLLFTYLELNEIDRGIALYHRLEPVYRSLTFTNKMTAFMHSIYAFLLFFTKKDYVTCEQLIDEIEHSDDITIVSSSAYIFDVCKALLTARIGNIDEAKHIFHQTINTIDDLIYVRYELKLWVELLEEYRLYDDVITYQKVIIQVLENQYASEISKVRKEMIEERSRQYYEGQIYVDQLTSVQNRNFYENLLAKQQKVKHYTVAVLDIDKFKLINDHYGHTVGDDAIKFVASHLSKWKPKYDASIIRYGGDEFIILLPYSIDETFPLLTQLHNLILNAPFYISKHDHTISISVSIGVGYTHATYHTLQTLFEVADNAIYKAKQQRGMLVIDEAK